MSSFLNLVLRENITCSPFVSEKHSVLAGVAVGLGALGAGLANLGSQADTNRTNEHIAGENVAQQEKTNEWNYRIAQEANEWNRRNQMYQNEWNEQMWNKQNLYNSPQHQVELLKAAGINPQGAVSSQPASQLTSADAKAAERAQMVAPQNNYHQQAFDFSGVGNAVGQAVNTYTQTRAMNAQAKYTDAQTGNVTFNTMRGQRMLDAEIKYWSARANKEGFEGDFARRQLDFYNKVFDTNVALVNGDLAIQQKNQSIMDEQLLQYQLDNKMKNIMIEFQGKMNDKQLRQMDATLDSIRATIALTYARADLTYAEKEKVLVEKLGAEVDNQMKGIDKEIKERTKDYSIGIARENLYNMEDTRYFRPFQLNYEMQGKAGQWISHPTGQFATEELRKRNQSRDRFRK